MGFASRGLPLLFWEIIGGAKKMSLASASFASYALEQQSQAQITVGKQLCYLVLFVSSTSDVPVVEKGM